jgi:hypothetical protein
MHEIFLNWDGPTIISGDLNLVRWQSDKSNVVIDFKLAKKFNAMLSYGPW